MRYDSELYTRAPLVTSAGLAWRGLRVEQYQLEAMKLPAHHHQHHLLLLYQQVLGPVAVQRQQGNRTQEDLFCFGDLGLYPGGEYGTVAWNGPTDTINIYIDDQHLETTARQAMDLTHFTLSDRLRFKDDLLIQVGRQLFQAVGTTHALGLLYVESLTSTLCYHLIEHYATYQQRITEIRRLPTLVLNRIDAYLEAYADQTVTLEALAELANLSVFYFSRLFKKTTGMSPYQYVMNWKIRRAQQLLRTDTPSVDISYALGFASPAHFSTVFKRVVGIGPRAYRRGRVG